MALVYNLPQSFPRNPSRIQKMRTSSGSYISHRQPQKLQKVICAKERKRCLRCNTIYQDKDNSPTACSFHGHTSGMRSLYFVQNIMWNKEKNKETKTRKENIIIDFFWWKNHKYYFEMPFFCFCLK